MKVGDRVKLIGIPPNLRDIDEMLTRTLFEKCVGRSFTVVALEAVEGLPYQIVKLNVGHVLGRPEDMECIWVEPEYLHLEPE